GGGAGGAGLSLSSTGNFEINGTIAGGAGGLGGYGGEEGYAAGVGGDGGSAGAGLILSGGGDILNLSLIAGGAGGGGGGYYSFIPQSLRYQGYGGGGGAGVEFSGPGVIANYGTIEGGVRGFGRTVPPGSPRPPAEATGIILSAGGTIANGNGRSVNALIAGGIGVYAAGAAAATVTNYGTIAGLSGAGVYLVGGGILGNEGSNVFDALIKGAVGVLTPTSAVATVTNHGTIVGTVGAGIDLGGGGFVTNGAADNTSALVEGGSGAIGPVSDGQAGGAGVSLRAVGMVTNDGSIQGGQGGRGGITRPTGGVGGPGAALAAGGDITNGGIIEGGGGGFGYAGAQGGPGGPGVTVKIAGGVVNQNVIEGGSGVDGSGGGVGVALGGSATLTNQGMVRGGAGAANATNGKGGVGGAGIVLTGSAGLLNQGVIEGGFGAASLAGVGGIGVSLGGGGLVNQGLIQGGLGAGQQGVGGAGVSLSAAGHFTNLATVSGGPGGVGVVLAAGGSIANGDAAHHAALIDGAVGVYAHGLAAATVISFGTIEGAQKSVVFSSPNDRLVMEAGARFLGAIDAGGGVLELAGGAGDISGLSSLGTISGGDSATFAGFGALVIDAGGVWTFAGPNAFNPGVSLTNHGTSNIVDALWVNGALVNTGAIVLTTGASAASLVMGADTTLSGRGTVSLGSGAGNRIVGASTSTLLTNIDNIVSGAGQLGQGRLTLVNQAKGIIDASGASALVIDTGVATIANAGTIEASGAGGGIVASAVANAGTLMAAGGVLTVEGAVSGAGRAAIDGGTLDFTSTFNENVFFGPAGGVLELAQSQSYTAAILGFSLTGGTSLDLRDIAFVGAGEAVFRGTANSGMLTVSDGTHTARIRLVGDYRASSFVASSDGHGGVIVVDPPWLPTPPSPLPMIAAMAAFAGGGGEPVHTFFEPWRGRPMLLAARRVSIA
nr:hypothetical protein [Pseudomonadota bacterium]